MKHKEAIGLQIVAILFILGNGLYNLANSVSITTVMQQQVIALSGIKGLLWGIFFMLTAIVSIMMEKK